MLSYDDNTYSQPFPNDGTLEFTGTKGGSTLTTQNMKITDTTTLKDLATFMQSALGIQQSPGATPTIRSPPMPAALPPGATITADGRLEIVGNNGTDNAVNIGLSAFNCSQRLPPSNQQCQPAVQHVQTAVGQSTTTDMVVYDSLGMPLSVPLTAVLQDRTSSYTEYRWFADCGQNDPGRASRTSPWERA